MLKNIVFFFLSSSPLALSTKSISHILLCLKIRARRRIQEAGHKKICVWRKKEISNSQSFQDASNTAPDTMQTLFSFILSETQKVDISRSDLKMDIYEWVSKVYGP